MTPAQPALDALIAELRAVLAATRECVRAHVSANEGMHLEPLEAAWEKLREIAALPFDAPAPVDPAAEADKITLDELADIFDGFVPMVALKVLAPEKSEPMTAAEVRQVLRALAQEARHVG
jgi:hypothetical protein